MDQSQEYHSFQDQIQEADKKKSKGSLWIIQALTSAVLFGICNSIYSILSRHGLFATSFFGPSGLALVTMDYLMDLRRKSRQDGGRMFERKRFRFFILNEHTGQYEFSWFRFSLVFFNSAQNFVIAIVIAFSFKFGKIGNVNTGILACLFNLQAFLTAALFFLVYRERISRTQFFGMFMLFICIILFSIEASNKVAVSHTQDGQVRVENTAFWAFLAILLAIITPFIFTFKIYFIRRLNDIYPAWEWNRDGAIPEHILYIILVIGYSQSPTAGITTEDWIIGLVCGILVYCGKQVFCQAVLNGYAGPAGSLQSTSALFTSLINFLAYGEQVMPLEIVGFLIGIFGAFCLTSGDFIMEKLKKKQKKEEEVNTEIQMKE